MQHDIVHVSAGDLLRAEIAAGTENGKLAKEYMTRGDLVPNEILVKVKIYQSINPISYIFGTYLEVICRNTIV